MVGQVLRAGSFAACAVLVAGVLGAGADPVARATTPSGSRAAAGPRSSEYTRAYDISDNGWVVGMSMVEPGSGAVRIRRHAVVWTSPQDSPMDLGSFTPPADETVGLGISSDGRLAVGEVWVGVFDDTMNRTSYATLWHLRTHRAVDLSGGVESSALAVNRHGQVVGWSWPDGGDQVATVWPAAGHHPVVFDPRPSMVAWSVATANNDRGQVVGSVMVTRKHGRAREAVTKAFVWSPRTGLTKLLTGFGRLTRSDAYGINSRGQVVGVYQPDRGRGGLFLWHPRTGRVTDLGSLGGGTDRAQALSINDDGYVVGRARRPSGVAHAIIWSPDMRRMVSLPGVPGPSTAHGINAGGQVVGVYDPSRCVAVPFCDMRAFLWDPLSETMTTLPPLVLPPTRP